MLLALGVVWMGRRPIEPQALPPPSAIRVAPAGATTPATDAEPGAPAATRQTLPLTSPRQTIAAELALLGTDRVEAFRSTFLPEIQAQITPEVFLACKARVMNRAVRPDWEVAEERVVSGRRVLSVSIFGKSTTGFVEVSPDEWRADAVWCLPPRP